MELPLRAFWLYSNSIDRIKAYDDRRALKIAICSQDGESSKGLIEELNKELGEVVKGNFTPVIEKMDRAGFEELRNMAQMGH